jgi:hypothetical protein
MTASNHLRQARSGILSSLVFHYRKLYLRSRSDYARSQNVNKIAGSPKTMVSNDLSAAAQLRKRLILCKRSCLRHELLGCSLNLAQRPLFEPDKSGSPQSLDAM